MDSNDTGFFFGSTPPPPPPKPAGRPEADDEDVDAIEVGGDPVSRSEAKKMGLVNPEKKREARSATTKMRLAQLPPDVSDELAGMLERAWSHLKRNETEEALTLAQEAVWQYPSLVAAKLIIARCFINRKEYDKSLAILQAIPDAERDGECYYYIGLCHSRVGNFMEAIEALKRCRNVSEDPLLRKRAADLLQHLQGVQTTCPICGRKTLYDSMVEVGNQTICANCAKSGNLDDDDDFDDDDDRPRNGRGRRKRLRPPLSLTDILVRLLFASLLVGLMVLGVYALYMVSPEYYAKFRGLLPAHWSWPPQVRVEQPPPPSPLTLQEDVVRVIDSMVFESPPVATAVVGVEVRRSLAIPGMEDRGGEYTATFIPEPTGPYSIDPETHEFVWTPSPEDAHEPMELTFGAQFGSIRAVDQVNRVRVSPGPVFRKLGEWPEASPLALQRVLVDSLGEGGPPQIILTAGRYSRGEIAVFEPGADGALQKVAGAGNVNHPVGAGVIKAGAERWLCVADYWTSRLRNFALRNGNLSEMAVSVELPGKPILAAFDRDRSLAVVLCRGRDGYTALAYSQEGQLQSRQAGSWKVSDDMVWRKIIVKTDATDPDEPPVLILVGADFATGIQMLDTESGAVRVVRSGGKGTIVDAIACGKENRVICLVEGEGGTTVETVDLTEFPEAGKYPSIPVAGGPALCGFGAVRMSGAPDGDLVILSTNRAGLAFGGSDTAFGELHFWNMPVPGRLFGNIAAYPMGDEAGETAIFVDNDGGVWSLGLTE